MPQALSGMGWLHTKNVHAQHACDHDCFSSVTVMKKVGKRNRKKKKEHTHLHSLCKYAQDAANIFE